MSRWETLGRWTVVIGVSVAFNLMLRVTEIWGGPEWTVWIYRQTLSVLCFGATVRWVFR